ncbi:MAG: c-type cytochrome [Epsilonproteobacteria bacterium]|nr:c-type cytochrome [Campylobacterota bacterium]
MIRHLIAAIATILALWASYYMYTLDKQVHKLDEIHRIIKASEIKVQLKKPAVVKEETQPTAEENAAAAEEALKSKTKELDKKLEALKNKAGNLSAFKVSKLYKQNCSSCHGVNGRGIIGPNLVGKSKEYILEQLKEFKSGKRRNYVMYGLLQKMDEEKLDQLATEISTFKEKWDKYNNQ